MINRTSLEFCNSSSLHTRRFNPQQLGVIQQAVNANKEEVSCAPISQWEASQACTLISQCPVFST